MSFFAGKKVLITGGAGFIGSNLAQALVPQGAKVVVLDAMLPEYGGNKFNWNSVEDGVEFMQGDIRDEKLVSKGMQGVDVVFDLAAQVSYLDSQQESFLDLDINGRGRLMLLEAVRQYAPKARLVFASSRLVYGRILSLPVREDHPTNPLSLYGIHKLLGEKYYSYYAREHGVHGVSVRIPNPYGPRQQMKHAKYSIVGWFIRQAMEGKELTIYGDGQQERDYLYIDDIVEACFKLAELGEAGEVYNVGTHERIKFADMVEAVLQEVGEGSKKHVGWPKDYEKNETGDYIADTTKIKELTGWEPKVDLQTGIKQMVDYYREHGKHYW